MNGKFVLSLFLFFFCDNYFKCALRTMKKFNQFGFFFLAVTVYFEEWEEEKTTVSIIRYKRNIVRNLVVKDHVFFFISWCTFGERLLIFSFIFDDFIATCWFSVSSWTFQSSRVNLTLITWIFFFFSLVFFFNLFVVFLVMNLPLTRPYTSWPWCQAAPTTGNFIIFSKDSKCGRSAALSLFTMLLYSKAAELFWFFSRAIFNFSFWILNFTTQKKCNKLQQFSHNSNKK